MKILIMNPFYWPNHIGGTETIIKLLAEKMIEKGNVVAVYTLDGISNTVKKEEYEGVLVYRGCGGYRAPIKKLRGIDRIKNAILQRINWQIGDELQKVICDFKPDVINTHNLYGFSSMVWRFIHRNNIPLVHTLNDNWLMKKTVYPFALLNAKAVDFFVAPSDYTLSIHEGKLFRTESRVIANGIKIDKAYFARCLSEKDKRDESKKIIFMFVGQLEKIKGIDRLMNEFSHHSEKNMELHIYGRGSLKKMVDEYSHKDSRIIYHGFIMPEQMDQAYENADVVVVPSIWQEPFGMVAIEAYAHGCPVIASNRGGLREVIQVMGGVLIDPAKKGSIYNALDYYMDRKNIQKDIKAIDKQLLETYDVECQANQYFNIFREIKEKYPQGSERNY